MSNKIFRLIIKSTCILILILTGTGCSFDQDSLSYSRKASPTFTLDTSTLSQSSRLVWLDLNGMEQSLSFSKESLDSSNHLRVQIKDCPKNKATPILLYKSDPDITPLGTIYPYSTIINQQNGFAADILMSLYKSQQSQTSSQATSQAPSPQQVQEYLSHFNWSRLMQELQNYPNPWILDRQQIMTKIASGNFAKTDIKPCSEVKPYMEN